MENDRTAQEQERGRKLERSTLLSLLCLLLWIAGVAMMLFGAPMALSLTVGNVGAGLALWDRAFIKDEVGRRYLRHPDPDISALIKKEITISEYRRRKEARDGGIYASLNFATTCRLAQR